MSGQPSKTKAEANKKRNEYMETLALQESINDMNLQANKTYLLTGQLPPQSQLQDTRTTAEKLADIEGMKRKIADDLRPIAEPVFAYAIVDKVMSSPLNADGGLLRFLAQRAPSIAEQLKTILTYGIAGDINDLERIVDFIKNMYTKQQSMFQSTKSYFNSVSAPGGKGRIIDSNDVDKVIYELQDILKQIQVHKASLGGSLTVKLNGLALKLEQLKHSLLSTSQLQRLLADSERAIHTTDYGAQSITAEELQVFFQFIEKLPKYETIVSLFSKLKRYIAADDAKVCAQIVKSIIAEFASLFTPDFDTIVRRFEEIKTKYSQEELQAQRTNEIQTRDYIRAQSEEQRDLSKAQKVYIINPDTDPARVQMFGAIPAAAPAPIVRQERPQIPQEPLNRAPIRAPAPAGFANVNPLALQARQARISQIARRMTDEEFAQLIELIGNPEIATKEQLAALLAGDPGYDIGDYGIAGLGIKKRRIGRPRGSGMPKPVPIKIPTFVGFGINEINQKQLENGIVKIRRNTRTNYPDMPSKRVSKNLQSILKTIVGGGVPKYEELGNLDAEEKEYLHKLISRSNLQDRLSVPAPSKDQQEKDIHNFEVMRGQILSGNDNKDFVRKFKLLMRKLARQGLLPKAEVNEMIDILTDIGY